MEKNVLVISCQLSVVEGNASSLPRTTNRGRRTPPGGRLGISLLEVLISMFVLLFGLLGVAAIFPVGNQYAGQADKFDRAAALTDQAFGELKARWMLRPSSWLYPHSTGADSLLNTNFDRHVIQPLNVNSPTPGAFGVNPTAGRRPGYAFIIDPLGVATGLADAAREDRQETDLDTFPYGEILNPFDKPPTNHAQLPGARSPLRRITVPGANPDFPTMTPTVAQSIFRLRDDVINAETKQDDRPGAMAWTSAVVGTIDDPEDTLADDDLPAARSYGGSYSWMATVVPIAAGEGMGPGAILPHMKMQPAHQQFANQLYDVSVAVFYKRNTLPSADSERILTGELYPGGELVVYAGTSEIVDAAVRDIRVGEWIAVMGVRTHFGATAAADTPEFLLKWYKVLSMDDESTRPPGPTRWERHLMLEGPDWPQPTDRNGVLQSSVLDLRAIFMPGIVSVSTQQLHLER